MQLPVSVKTLGLSHGDRSCCTGCINVEIAICSTSSPTSAFAAQRIAHFLRATALQLLSIIDTSCKYDPTVRFLRLSLAQESYDRTPFHKLLQLITAQFCGKTNEIWAHGAYSLTRNRLECFRFFGRSQCTVDCPAYSSRLMATRVAYKFHAVPRYAFWDVLQMRHICISSIYDRASFVSKSACTAFKFLYRNKTTINGAAFAPRAAMSHFYNL